MKIFKYILDDCAEIGPDMFGRVLSAKVQQGQICVWVEIFEVRGSDQNIKFYVVPTGQTMDMPQEAKFLDTVLLHEGALVYHIYYMENV